MKCQIALLRHSSVPVHALSTIFQNGWKIPGVVHNNNLITKKSGILIGDNVVFIRKSTEIQFVIVALECRNVPVDLHFLGLGFSIQIQNFVTKISLSGYLRDCVNVVKERLTIKILQSY